MARQLPGTKIEPEPSLTPQQLAQLSALAHYVWWETPDEAIAYPTHLLCYIMTNASVTDEARLAQILTREQLSDVLANAIAKRAIE